MQGAADSPSAAPFLRPDTRPSFLGDVSVVLKCIREVFQEENACLGCNGLAGELTR